MKTTVELNNEIARHRKLLNRAVGDKILARINYHHYEIVQLITELDDVEAKISRLNAEGVFDKNVKALGDHFGKMLQEQFLKAEDNAILTGQFDNITTDKNGNHNDTHISK